MGRAEELFERLVTTGVAGIDLLISTLEPENLFLDYKSIVTRTGDRNLNSSDLKNLRKAVSGFGNTAGGVIVWGVDCKQGPDGADIPTKKLPAQNAHQVSTLMEGQISGLTLPPHVGVRNHVILTGKDSIEGFVITLVPEADNMPLQQADGSYYMRAGSSFVPIPNTILAAMFGRRPQPILDIDIEIGKQAQVGSQNPMDVDAYILIRNRGIGIAEGMYATVMVNSPEHCTDLVGSANDPHFEPAHAYGGMTSVIAHKDKRLPPGAALRALRVRLTFSEFVAGELVIRISAGTSNGPPVHRELRISENKLNHSLQLYKKSHADGCWLTKRVFGLTDN